MSMIKIENLTFSYPTSYDNVFENVSFQVDTDWKLGFVGRNGRGKTTFLNLLLGKYEYSGKSYHPYSLIIFLIPFQIRIVLQRIYCRRFARLRKNGNLCENFLILMLMSMCFGDLLKHFPTESRQRFCLPLFFLMKGISY